MSGLQRWLMLAMAAAAAGGCAFGRKPYTDDPLIRSNRAVWGDRTNAHTLPDEPPPEPNIPAAPNQLLVGAKVSVE